MSRVTSAKAAAFALTITLAAACSSAASKSSTDKTVPATSPTTFARVAGPAADLSTEITGDTAPFMGEGTATDLAKAGYVQHEYLATGTATSYKAVGTLSNDGKWTFAPDTNAAYRTRVLVRRPSDASKFNGTVVVEWLNVSGGIDADPDYISTQEELTRAGDIWVGVSAQLIGIEGGPVLVSAPGGEAVAGKGLKKIDAARYGSLHHPGDGYSFDIFTQVARALRAGGAPLGNGQPKFLIAAGESQSAIAMTTYYDGVQPLTHAFDAFFVHSRGSSSLPLVGPGKAADLASSIGSTLTPVLREDGDAPAMELQTESDVTGLLKSVAVRQPDTDHFRLWEVPGTAHADVHLVSPAIASKIDCGTPINDGPMHVVAKAALHDLDQWLRTGHAPPIAPRFELTTGATPETRRDADGIALGGIRTPPVDVPVDVLSGVPGSNPAVICLLLGSTKPLPAARLAQLYPSRADYRTKFDAATDKAIKDGFVLEADRQALLAYAQPSRISG